jgi:hypothetical protein
MVMSTYYIYNKGMDPAPPDLTQIPQASLLPLTDPLTLNRLRYYHDRSIQFAMRYAASFPYDWGAPRPYNRCIMTDYPLFEYDMFSPTHKGTISGTGGMPAEQWCPISAQTITSIGLPQLYPGVLKNDVWDNTTSPFVPFDGLTRAPNPPNIWGNASHFTLTKPFKPAERCRQLVFWSADWQSYEDAETAPSAPMDASKCPLDGPSGYYLFPGGYQLRLNNYIPYSDGLFYRNPERQLNFISDISQIPTGTDIAQYLEIGRAVDTAGPRPFNTNYAPAVAADSGLPILNGVYGADRNHNYMLDRGPIKKSTQIRATLIARFNFYDPRLPITIR